MNFLISFIVPSLLGFRLLEKLIEKQFQKRDFIFYYLMFLLFTNSISVVFSCLLFGLNGNLEASLLASPIFSVKYILLSIVVSIFLGIVFAVIKRYVSVSLEVVKNEKKVKKKSK